MFQLGNPLISGQGNIRPPSLFLCRASALPFQKCYAMDWYYYSFAGHSNRGLVCELIEVGHASEFVLAFHRVETGTSEIISQQDMNRRNAWREKHADMSTERQKE